MAKGTLLQILLPLDVDGIEIYHHLNVGVFSKKFVHAFSTVEFRDCSGLKVDFKDWNIKETK